jgi:predicted 3-demethylubiquinone-9 3-methyltransferase (glyoxalase superfamily)
MGVKPGSVLTLHLTLRGQKIMLLRGGDKPVACGWLIDRFGVRWQIAPAEFDRWNTHPNRKKREAVAQAMWQMVKLDRATLQNAFDAA